jgi:hypothetical protein
LATPGVRVAIKPNADSGLSVLQNYEALVEVC